MPLMLVCFSRFIVDLTFVLLKRNLSWHHISVLLTYTTAGRLPLDVILLYNSQYITGEKTSRHYRNPALVKAMVNHISS